MDPHRFIRHLLTEGGEFGTIEEEDVRKVNFDLGHKDSEAGNRIDTEGSVAAELENDSPIGEAYRVRKSFVKQGANLFKRSRRRVPVANFAV
eukprot:CAMPEP_0115029102 /NCGR_PEP_ID=MMETSP0216-20121206/36771_1 /TAXON_ID=223996 /ORGANISM="Protocruzia adherens, Strain Boccale" /LENGTH=91 /DNA_ID=CAMNT_0002405563 /DNA_START=308 /DNA_END=583 /DNA_ORIENTATION=-